MDSHTIQFYVGIIVCIRQLIGSDEFKQRHRISEKAFSRRRILTFDLLILFLLNMVKHATQDELDEFFKILQGEKIAMRIVTKSAFSQARTKLKYSAFIELNHAQVAYFYQHVQEPQRWYGLRLLAIDGSMSDLPDSEEVRAHFGVWHPQSGGTCAKARVSQLFDVLNKITVDAIIAPKSYGERVLAERHLGHLEKGDMLIMDRGYPAFWLFAAILDKEADFCVRLTVSEWNVAKKFVASGKKEQFVLLRPGYEAKKACRERGLPIEPIRVRLIRVELLSGEIEVLATSLLDRTSFPHTVFQELYHHRWPIEEDYKVIKSRLEVENWNGKSVKAVYQEFHATIFTKNHGAILAHPAQQLVNVQTEDKKYRYQINLTNLISKMKNTIVYLLHDTDILPILQALWEQMTKTIEPIRPGRSFPRKKPVKRKRFIINYKAVR
ncbi:IS4 family transposase [Chloroflexota bacterium]